ncbi:MAG: hypothetical protein HYT64_02300 [Candidatus Yanofskybacteria bacterium]|nr:hypothetical protein [Candidatus Yanofskybacteria bacterium]
MQTKFITFYLIVTALSFFLAGFIFAEGDRNPLDSSYLFYLYYDNGQLFADRDVQYKYDVIPEKFVPETLSTQFPYKGEVINLKGEVAETFQFDPRRGNPKFLKGKISVKASYMPDGQKVVLYNYQGDALLTIFVSESSFCNDDGVCNPDVGEDTKTCPSDCKISTPPPAGGPTITTGTSSGGAGMIKVLIYLIIGLGVAGGGWYGWKWWKGRQAPPKEMPTLPSPPPSI